MEIFRILIALIYAKSLFLQKEYVRCFELLQHEYINFPSFLSLLYAYSKYVVLSQTEKITTNPMATTSSIMEYIPIQRNYIGSALGALEECLRSQVKERHPKLSYLLGKAYFEMKRPLKVNEYWSTLIVKGELDSLKNKKKISEVKKYLESIEDIKTL